MLLPLKLLMIIGNVGDLTLFNSAVLFNCAANNLYTMAVDIQICLKLFTLFNIMIITM